MLSEETDKDIQIITSVFMKMDSEKRDLIIQVATELAKGVSNEKNK